MNTWLRVIPMYIEKITLTNFRIYSGENNIELSSLPDKNITIISGDNGHGKTTLLTALVWCLYGKQMQEVDKFYKDRIIAAGGYKKYLSSCMNRLARAEGQTEFSVTTSIREADLPGVTSSSLQIRRSCNITSGNDSLEIRIDGVDNELVHDFGKQVFIQDFVLPKEIAKFFFFDAERIVSIAEIQTDQEKRLLSHAYTEVLGIKKYEDLRNSLNDLRIRFRRDSANEFEKTRFHDLGEEINSLERSIKQKESRKDKLSDEKSQLKIKSDEFQDKLLREGDYLTLADIRALQEKKDRLREENKSLMNKFRDLFEIAPFAIANKNMMLIEKQLDDEMKQKELFMDRKLLTEKIRRITQDLKDNTDNPPQYLDNQIKDYYITKVDNLLNKYLLEDVQGSSEKETLVLHDFTDEQTYSFNSIMLNLRTSFKGELQSLYRELRINRVEYSGISKKISRAENSEVNSLIGNYKHERDKLELRIHDLEDELLEITQSIGAVENNLLSKRKLYEDLAKKIRVNEQYRSKDQLAARLITELENFISAMKRKKKTSLEQRILLALTTLMHKKDFIKEVTVEINGDILDICLKDRRGNIITKDDLSRGEQQLYAMAILKSMAEESRIDFPIFIDSPLQKFDDKHSRSIINRFYPQVGKQVILLPLLGKELTEEEFALLLDHVNSTFIIENYCEDASRFKEVESSALFIENERLGRVLANVTIN